MSATITTPAATQSLPFGRTIRLGFGRIRYEVRSYFRQGDRVFFTFLFPLLMLGLFSVIFSNGTFGKDASGNTITAAEYYLPAMLAAGLLLSGLQNMSIDIAGEKGDGTLKRLGGSPLPVFSYFIGKIGQVLVTGILQAAVLIVAAALLFGVKLPTDASKWLTFVWVFLLGVTTCAILGIALSALPRSGRSATAVIIPITLILQFISGVYIQFSVLPTWLQNVASAFPLKWLALGMRSVFMPDGFKVLEQGHSWDLSGVLIATLIWLVVGLVLCRVTFRWIRKDS
jgi:ABC-2 type transport system permease protein